MVMQPNTVVTQQVRRLCIRNVAGSTNGCHCGADTKSLPQPQPLMLSLPPLPPSHQ